MHGCLMVLHRPSDSLGKRCLIREILERIGTNHPGNDQTSHRLGIFLDLRMILVIHTFESLCSSVSAGCISCQKRLRREKQLYALAMLTCSSLVGRGRELTSKVDPFL
jgi:hypothetical protein